MSESSKTILVTGATGFIGGALARRLTNCAHQVRVLVRRRDGLGEQLAESCEVVVGDVTDPASLKPAVSGVAKVFHIAGAFREPRLSDERYLDVNVRGTRNLLDASVEAGVRRFIHCSTSGIHGSIVGPPATEDHEVVLDEVYERTKAEGEREVLKYWASGDLEAIVLRPAQVYGPGDLRLLKLFKMVDSKITLWFGDGRARYHLLYIDDLVDAFVLAGNSETAPGHAFLIAGPQMPTLNEVVAAVGKAVGKERLRMLRLPAGPFLWLGGLCERVCIPLGVSPPIYRRRVEFFTKNKAYDISKARRILGFEPRVGMNEGLANTAKWYRETGAL